MVRIAQTTDFGKTWHEFDHDYDTIEDARIVLDFLSVRPNEVWTILGEEFESTAEPCGLGWPGTDRVY